MWMAFLTAAWLPKTMAERTNHVSLRRAWVAHFSAAVLGLAAIWYLVEAESAGSLFDVEQVWDRAMRDVRSLVREFRRDPLLVAAAIGGCVAAFEAGIVVLALLVMPWGARDEPVRASFAHALRRTWLQTPHALVGIIVAGMVAVGLFNNIRAWHRAPPGYPGPAVSRPRPPRLRPGGAPAPTTAAVAQYQAAMKRKQAARVDWRRRRAQRIARRPWHVKYRDELAGYAIFAAITWYLWGLFRAAGAPRPVKPIARPPTCEFCGYNLTMAEPDGRCPECGKPVADSLGDHCRPGVLWERRAEVGLLRAWWRCVWDPIRRPRWFARQLNASADPRHHRVFLLIHIVPIFAIAYAGAVASLWFVATPAERLHLWEERTGLLLLTFGPISGYSIAVIAAAIGLVATAVLGTWEGWRDGRNLMSRVMPIACYLSGALVIGTTVAALAGVAAILLEAALDKSVPLYSDTIAFAAYFTAIFVWFVWYQFLLYLGTNGVRYANR